MRFRTPTPQPQSLDKRWKPRQWDDSKWDTEVPAEFQSGLDLGRSVLEDEGRNALAGGNVVDAEFMVRPFALRNVMLALIEMARI